MRKGDKLLCKRNILDYSNSAGFEKGKIYVVNYIENETTKIFVYINHDSPYIRMKGFDIEWIFRNFKII